MQVLIRRRGVADMKLNGLPHPNEIGDCQRPGVLIHAQNVSNQKVAALELFLVFVDDPADVKPLLEQFLFFRLQLLEKLLQMKERRPAAQLLDDVFLRSRNDHGPADWTAALRDDTANANR